MGPSMTQGGRERARSSQHGGGSGAADVERELRDDIAGQRSELTALLAELVGIESHASQPAGVERVGRLVQQALVGTGVSWRRVRGRPPDAEHAWLAEVLLPGFDYRAVAEVVVGHREGGPGRVLLLGDLDTAFEPGAALRFPFRIEGGRAYGPGVADMKGGLVVLVAAMRALPPTEAPELTIVLSPDEQAGSLASRSAIEAAAADAEACLCVECARDGGNLMGSRAHIGVARLDVRGREAHAGSDHARGASAVEELAHKILAFKRVHDPAAGVYITVGKVSGGRRRSVVPGSASCTIDVRTPSATVWAETERHMREIVATTQVPGTTSELRIHAHRPESPWTERTDRLIDVARRAGAAAGITFGVIRSPAAGSSSFVGSRGVPTLDGMGPRGGDLMTDREHIELDTVPERALLLALTLHYLASQNGGVA